MRFPVDTSALRFAVAGAPERLQRHEHDFARSRERMQPAEDAERWRVPLLVAGAGPEEVVRVTVARDPRLEADMPVRVEDLTLLTWKRPGGCGFSLRARAITPEPMSAPRERS
jgi:hypothetical protein